MNLLADLFLTFAQIGLFTFGGGYAMISLIEDKCVEKKKWISHDDLMNVIVIAESTPGPIAINCATFVGYRQKGFAGALAATLGIVLPSFAVIYIISVFFDRFLEISLIANAFRGIKIAVGILIVNAGVTMIRKMRKSGLACGILICACAVMLAVNFFSLNISSVVLMLLAGLFSVVAFRIREYQKGGGEG